MARLRRITDDIACDPAEVVFAQRFGQLGPLEPSVQIHFRSGASAVAVGDSTPEFWEGLTAGTGDGPATLAGDGVLVRVPGTAPALVIYAENRDSLRATWDESEVHTNVFVLGMDPRKQWSMSVDGKPPARVFPNPADGHWQAPVQPTAGTHLLLLHAEAQNGTQDR